MKKWFVYLLVLIPIIAWSVNSWATTYPKARITIKVIDEQKAPIEGIEVGVTFEVAKKLIQGIKFVSKKGLTDGNGKFTATSPTIFDVSYGASSDGYYESFGKFHFGNPQNGRWQPWNPEVELVLRKIENPVPMYARRMKLAPLEIPVAGEPVGFDLIEYDWVAPHGKGTHPDFIFKLDRKFINERDFDCKLTITFANPLDGIILVKEDRRYGSKLKLPRYAPEEGYQRELVHFIKRKPGNPIENDFEADNNYIFRIRSEEQNNKLNRAMYGKIQGDIEFYPRIDGTTRVFFTYFLNPDYTRNLESGENLFKDIPQRERPRIDQ